MKFMSGISEGISRVLVFVGGLFLMAMIVLTCSNIFLRLVWAPVRGTFELMGFFGALVAAFALGYTQIKRGHIAVDVLVNTFKKRNIRLTVAINSVLCGLFMAVCAWQVWLKAGVLWRSGEVTETLRIIYYPFTYGVAVGCGVLTLVFLADLVKAVFPGKDGGS